MSSTSQLTGPLRPFATANPWILSALVLTLLMTRCNPLPTTLTVAQTSAVADSVTRLASDIAKAVDQQGPVAWLQYFSQTPDFYMASDGRLSFVGYASARAFILDTLTKQLIRIHLQWSGLRIDPISPQAAMMAASFQEKLTDSSGKELAIHGYFSAWVKQTDQGWKLANAHWSTAP